MKLDSQKKAHLASNGRGAFAPMRRYDDTVLVDFGDLLKSIWSDAWILIAIIIFCMGTAYIVVQNTAPTYWAASKIMLNSREIRLSAGEFAAPRLEVNEEIIANEVAVLKSNLLVERLVDRLALGELPEFSVENASKGPITRLISRLRRLFPDGSPDIMSDDAGMRTHTQVIDQVQANFSIQPIGISHSIQIGFLSQSKELSAKAANTLAQIYIESRYEESLRETQRASSLLADQTAAWRKDVSALETEIVERRSSLAGMEQSNRPLVDQLLLDTARELNTIRSERIATESRLASLRKIEQDYGRSRVGEVIENAELSRFRENRTEALIKQKELSASLGPENEASKAAASELRSIDELMQQKVNIYLSSLEDDLRIKRFHEEAISEQLQRAINASVVLEQTSIELDQLEREGAAAREIYEALLQRLNQTRAEEAFGRAGAKLIERADVPLAHAYPKKALTLVASLIVGFFIGLIVIVARQLVGGQIRSMDEIERLTNHPVLAAMPKIGLWNRFRMLKQGLYLGGETSDALRRLRFLMLSTLSSNSSPPVYLFTSAHEGEGKTSTCLGLAQYCAWSHKKVIVIDANFRAEGFSSRFAQAGSLGFADALETPTKLEQMVLSPDELSFQILPAGISKETAIDLLTNDLIQEVFEMLREKYDLIFIDAPHMAGGAGASGLLSNADGVIVIYDTQSTHRRVLQSLVSYIHTQTENVIGIVANRVTFQNPSTSFYGKIKPNDLEENWFAPHTLSNVFSSRRIRTPE